MRINVGFSGRRLHVARLLAGAALLLAYPAQAAEFASSIGLETLDGTTGIRIAGGASTDLSGNSVSDAGDVNGDGFADVIIGAYAYGALQGASYVVFGKASGLGSNINLTALDGTTGFRLIGGADGDEHGKSVSAAGDVNGDGFGDVIIGSPGYGATNSGASYVVFGKASFAGQSAIAVSSLAGATGGFRVTGTGDELFGTSVSAAGDVNGDGFGDVIIGAPFYGSYQGASYVVFGKASFSGQSNIDVTSLTGATGFRLTGEADNDQSGFAVAGAGDVNGDGLDDVIVGALINNVAKGASYVVFGKASFAGQSVIALAGLDGTTGFRLIGEAGGDLSGSSVSAAGDVNGDGFGDVIVGSVAYGENLGASYVVMGKTSFAGQSAIELSGLDGTSGFRLTGEIDNSKSGVSVSTAGDVNGDGFDDVIVGAHYRSNFGNFEGASYLVFGKTSFAGESSIGLASLDGLNGFRLTGALAGDQNGKSVSTAGDVNGDGFDDIIMGSPFANAPATDSGLSHVLFGRAPDAGVLRAGSAAGQRINGGAFVDTLIGNDGNDALEGRGAGDALLGGSGSNTASYAHALTGVRANLASPGGNTGDALGDSYTAISNLEGSGLNDTLTGNGSANRITGGKGKDALKGGNGNDTFTYRLSAESPAGTANRDTILDFKPGTGSSAVDKIDVSAIDAKTSVGGNQAFTWRGTKSFNGPGQLRINKTSAGVVVQGNTTGNGGAEFEILLKDLTNTSAITAKDFKL